MLHDIADTLFGAHAGKRWLVGGAVHILGIDQSLRYGVQCVRGRVESLLPHKGPVTEQARLEDRVAAVAVGIGA